jgi:hypothetical protein
MSVVNQEQKRMRLKRFLRLLSEDPSILIQKSGQRELPSLGELLLATGCMPGNEPVDLAALMSGLLKKLGMEACYEDMMNHVMSGGTVEEFMQGRKYGSA